MTRQELENHVGPVYVLRECKVEAVIFRMMDTDSMCAVCFSDNSIGWRPVCDIYPSRMELLLAWEDTLMGLIVKATKAVEDCRKQIQEERGEAYLSGEE